MKKSFRVFITLLLCISLFTVLSSVVSAKTVDEITAAVKAAGIEDDKFAVAVAKALSDAGLTDDSNYATDADTVNTLKNFNGNINASGQGITSIKGINLLLGANKVDLSNNRISDMTPMHLDLPLYYKGSFDFTDNPVSKYPVSVQTNTETAEWFSSNQNSCNVYKGCDFTTDIALLYSDGGNNVRIYFGVTEGGEYCWSTDGEELLLPEITKYTGSMNSSNTKWTYDYSGGKTGTASAYGTAKVTESGSFTVRAPYEYYRWACRYEEADYDPNEPFTKYSSPDRSSPEYRYIINVDYYTKVRQSTETLLLGGVKVTKTDANGKPLAGAEFGIYSDSECTTPAAYEETTDDAGEIIWSGLREGKYYVKELKAPAGYKTSDEVHEVTVSVGDIKWSTSIEGGSTIGGYYTGDVELEPDWKNWAVGLKYEPMSVKSGSYTTKGEGEVLIKNGGEELTKLVQEFDDSNYTLVSSDLVVKKNANDKGTSVKTVEDAKDLINGWINEGKLTSEYSDINVTGSVIYVCSEADFATLTVKDESLCVFLEPIANKKLVGREIKEGEFGFEITKCDEEGNTVGVFSGVNAAAEAGEEYTIVNFFDEKGEPAVMRFCKAGLYEFTLREVVVYREEGMVYDEADRAVSVVVTESGSKGLCAEVYVDGKLVGTFFSADTTNPDNTPAELGTADLASFVNRCTERANPSTGVPTMFSLLEILTAAGLGVVLKKKFF